jgi:hypothetical protein
VLVAERRSRGWGRERLAHEFERVASELGLRAPERAAMVKAIYRHETGRVELRDESYLRLYCAVYDLSRQELLGVRQTETVDDTSCKLTGHRFVPIYLGLGSGGSIPRGAQVLGMDCHRETLNLAGRSADLYAFPWDIAVVHISEELNVPNLTAVASWRRRTAAAAQEWAAEAVRQSIDSECISAGYAMSGFWVDSLPWTGSRHLTALRILAMPRVLLGRLGIDAEPSVEWAEHVERVLLRDGFADSRIDEFGTQGVSVGCASWAAVSYSALSPDRALRPADIVDFEVLVQALWSFCHRLRQQVEGGGDPAVLSGHGWRWMRGMRSRLTSARPNESAQHSAMREAILATSGLADQLTDAVELLRDAERS